MAKQNGDHPARDTGSESSNALARTGATADRTPGRELSVEGPPRLSHRPDPLHIAESTADGRRVITPCGELDLFTAAQLKQRLAGDSDTVLDLSELSFIDSTGIHLMVSTAQRARSDGWDFTVRNPRPAVLRVIKLVGLAEHFGLDSQQEEESIPADVSCRTRLAP